MQGSYLSARVALALGKEMARLDWITPHRVTILLFMALGIASLYRGVTTPIIEPVLGVDELVWLGLGFLIAGLLYWHGLRSKQDDADTK